MSLMSVLNGLGVPPASVVADPLVVGSVTTIGAATVGTNLTVAGTITDGNQGGQTALGTTQGTAFAITQMNTEFTTVAAGTGAVLPTFPATNLSVSWGVYNNGANALLVYPPTGAKLNALATNAGFTLAAGKNASFNSVSPTQAYVILSA